MHEELCRGTPLSIQLNNKSLEVTIEQLNNIIGSMAASLSLSLWVNWLHAINKNRCEHFVVATSISRPRTSVRDSGTTTTLSPIDFPIERSLRWRNKSNADSLPTDDVVDCEALILATHFDHTTETFPFVEIRDQENVYIRH